MSDLCHRRTWSASFDHLVSGCEQGRWHSEAKCLGGLEIDDKLEISRWLDRQISWFCSFENLPDVDASLTIQGREARPVTDKTSRRSEFLPFVDCRNGVTRCQGHDPLTTACEEGVRPNNEGVGLEAIERGEGGFNFVVVGSIQDMEPHSLRTCRLLHEWDRALGSTMVFRIYK